MPPRRSTRGQAKEEEKKKKDEMEEEEESEEEEEKTTTRGRKPAAKKAPAKKAPAKGKGRGKSKAAESEEEEEESEEEEKPKRATRGAAAKKGAKGKGKRGAAKSPEDSEEDEEEDDKKAPVKKNKGEDKVTMKKVVTKGGAAVDEYFDQGDDDYHVYKANGVTYSKTLNQSNLAKNNNKFYIIQLLENSAGLCYLFFRWGRVGYKGQTSSIDHDDNIEEAIDEFNQKLKEKKGRGYIEIDINYDDDDDKKDAPASDEEDKKKATTKKPARGKGKKDESEDEEEEDKKKKATPKKEDKEEEKKEVVKKVITKGGAAVDEYFDEKDCEVYMAGGKVYAKTLNQSNLTQNNNKFYIIQILESTKNKGTFFVWNRWGRVGVKGQTMKKKCSSAADAIAEFDKKFYDKTVKGDYVEVEINYDDEKDTGAADKDDDEEKDDKDDKNDSKLPEQTKDLIKLIFDLKMMNNQMKEIGYDPSRMPLGKLSKNAIQKGYEVLKQLADAIEKKKSRDTLNQLSSQFYSQIPHDIGFKQMSNFILDTDKKVKEKLEMLASLEDIQIATKLLDQGNANSEDSLIDANYKKLKCGLNPCEKDSDEFKMVVDYIKNTHASTHSSYSLELVNLFSVDREGEADRYTKDIHNKQLLWHGSRLTNYVGILSQGLRIAPPEAPVTGYMFGKGVYFADMVSKSANYCFTNPQNNTGIMLLCEVALGNCNEKMHADYNAANLPSGKHSTKGVGRTAPNAGGAKTIDGGDVVVPMGKGENQNVAGGGALMYNEFIVYDVKQIKIRYLLRLKFNYRYNY